MNSFDDPSHEMHDDSLTPETAERLIDGEILSPEFADLAAMVNDVSTMASATPIPEVRGALAEYVGVGLTTTETPAITPAAATVSIDLTTADQPRRKSMFAEAMTFAGTVSGKLLLGGAFAAASVTGAQVSGLVDVPLLPDKTETVVVADDVELPAELPLKGDFDESDDAEDDVSTEVDKHEDEVEKEEPKTEEPKKEEPKVEEPKKEEPKVEKPKTEEPKKEEPKKEEPKEEEPSEYELAAAALEEQLHKDKEAVYAAATELIKPLEATKKALIEELEETLGALEEARNAAKAPLYEELEVTEDPARRAEIEEELSTIFGQWEIDRDAAIAAAAPAINNVKQQLETIEIERDAEIERLLEKFRADLEALKD